MDIKERILRKVIRKEVKNVLNERSGKWVGRFVHRSLRYNQLPTHWTYPEADVFEGAQVLNFARTLDILMEGKDRRDDWFNRSEYDNVQFIQVSGFSGKSHGLGYKVIKSSDVKQMYVVSLSCTMNSMIEIAYEMEQDGFPVDMERLRKGKRWYVDFGRKEMISLVQYFVDHCDGKNVNPDFVKTVG